MINLKKRSYTKELMDADVISLKDMTQVLKELNFINIWLGGHGITIKGVKQLIKKNKHPLLICEIGCGGGDNLFAIYNWCRRQHIPARLIGIDKNAECITFAQQQYPDLPCDWICSDYAAVDFTMQQPDIIFSSLFCHHFTDTQLADMLQWLHQKSRIGFFINDLHRHWLAYYLIKYLTWLFSRSYLVKNDACLSVARSFTKEEWQQLLMQAGILSYSIRWKWAFRWLVTGKNNGYV